MTENLPAGEESETTDMMSQEWLDTATEEDLVLLFGLEG